MPYQPTWNNPYLAQNPYQPVIPSQTTQPYQQQAQSVQPYQQSVLQQSRMLVDGPTEAMNRFLMRYPANMLIPGFVSDALFDVNGHQFHTLSIESDGRRNLETFDFQPHVEEQPVEINGVEFASKKEFDELAAKVNAVMEVVNGLHEPVPAAAERAAAPTDIQAIGTGRHSERG